MTWKSFQKKGFQLTESEVEDLVPYIVGHYRTAIIEINKDLEKVYATLLSGVSPDDYYETMIKYNRLNNLLDSVTKQYSKYSRKVGVLVKSAGRIAMSNNFYRQQFAMFWIHPLLKFGIIPENLIELSVNGSVEAYKRYKKQLKDKIFGSGGLYYPQPGTLSEFLVANRAKEIEKIHRTITQGLIRGRSSQNTTSLIKDVIGKFLKKDGVVNVDGAIANTMRIVRTETTRILNSASLVNSEYARSQGVKIERFWNATLDIRTRASHGGLDDTPENNKGGWNIGDDFAIGPGSFIYVGNNVHCRCSTFESVNGSKPTIRRGRDPDTGENEVFSYKNFDKWAEEKGLKKNKFGEYYSTNDKPKKPKKSKQTKTDPVKTKPVVNRPEVKVKTKPAKDKPKGKLKRPDTFGLDLDKARSVKLPDRFKKHGKYITPEIEEEYMDWVWENWGQR